MAKDSILIGGDIEASCKITFNPKTFEQLSVTDMVGQLSLLQIVIISSVQFPAIGKMEKSKRKKAKMRMQGYESWKFTLLRGSRLKVKR